MTTTYPSRPEQTLPPSNDALYHEGMATYHYPAVTYPYVAETPPPQPPTPGPPPPDVKPPQRPRRRAKALGIGAAATAVLAAAVFGGFAAGRSNPKIVTTPAPTVTAMPQPQMFNSADADWCREYTATKNRTAELRKADGLPRDMAATSLPASLWSPEELKQNQDFQKYLESYSLAFADLQSSAKNPAIKSLMDTQMSALNDLSERIKSGTYLPTDNTILNTAVSSSVGLEELCVEIPRG
ncbi:putative membrane protein YdgH [Mycolicibacterium fortuitum subsp. acetamidolyticum]|uniref:Putative membrane protein YdgH n=1 Tax=Mycolicibacterium fortuitum subsp. acetamidolyticum TaxID=144550 RepID=A0A100WQP7_MYCFO|nr:hypothetical protein [Mycolicibacterium fortuitum]MCV7137685.1 hypothetical protein [Mycolicibacterium fortuitum]GAT02552.1 putative membrane protein YdgH [Mycolicibacterium fortuitum subsp. acetamidolyticum]